jgi:hypothetical protein
MSSGLHRITPLATAAALFGLLTLISGGPAIFGGPASKAAAGAAVPFVLWFNFTMDAI